jgi:hypothetical protein
MMKLTMASHSTANIVHAITTDISHGVLEMNSLFFGALPAAAFGGPSERGTVKNDPMALATIGSRKGVGFQNLATYVEQRFLCCSFVLVGQATQNWSTCDAFVAEMRDGVGRLRWSKVAGAVGPATVVVPNIFSEHCT